MRRLERRACRVIRVTLHFFWDYETTIRDRNTKIHRMAAEEPGEYADAFKLAIIRLCE